MSPVNTKVEPSSKISTVLSKVCITTFKDIHPLRVLLSSLSHLIQPFSHNFFLNRSFIFPHTYRFFPIQYKRFQRKYMQTIFFFYKIFHLIKTLSYLTTLVYNEKYHRVFQEKHRSLRCWWRKRRQDAHTLPNHSRYLLGKDNHPHYSHEILLLIPNPSLLDESSSPDDTNKVSYFNLISLAFQGFRLTHQPSPWIGDCAGASSRPSQEKLQVPTSSVAKAVIRWKRLFSSLTTFGFFGTLSDSKWASSKACFTENPQTWNLSV